MVDAVSQLMAPLVSSTLTTVVVFAPLGLLSGVVGQFFRALSMSLSVAVLVSLVLSVSVVPLLARWALGGITIAPSSEPDPGVLARALRALAARAWSRRPLAGGRRGRAARRRDRRRCSSSIGTGFLPPADEGGFVVDYLTPAGSALEETDRQVRAMEKVDRRHARGRGLLAPHRIGARAVRHRAEHRRHPGAAEAARRARPHRPRRSSRDLRPKLQEAAPLAEIEFVQLLQDMLGDLEGSPTPIEVKIFGDDPRVLETLAEPVEEMLEKIDGVVDVVGMQRGNPE